ncbi:MAG: hypothetical protein R2882_15790 [Gemmatimonadales bacterium]
MTVGCGGDDAAGQRHQTARSRAGRAPAVQEAFAPQIYDIAVVSSQRAWAVGASGVVFRWDGSTWSVDHTDFAAFRFFSVTALPGDFVMVAASSGPRGIWRRQGGTWTLDPTPNDAVSVWAASPTLAFAAAEAAHALGRNVLELDRGTGRDVLQPGRRCERTFAVASGNAGSTAAWRSGMGPAGPRCRCPRWA